MITITLRTLPALISGLVLAGGLFFFATPAHAVAPLDFVFTVNGGTSATIINGQDVTLAWYVNVPGVVSCVINNGVGPIDVSTLPASGSLTVTPPENTSTDYAMNCDGVVSSVNVDITPTVTMSLPQGDERTNSALTNRLDVVDVNWSSQFATRCGNVWREEESNPGVKIWASSNHEYRNKNQPAGSVRYRGWPHGYIDETTTFYIMCYNDENGSFATGSVKLTVYDPPPPPDPLVNVWTTDADAFVFRDNLSGYADVNIRFNSTGVTSCSYQAFYADGVTPYPELPRGFGQWSGHTGGNFTVRIATTTEFQVRCSRGTVTIGDITYPATSSFDRQRIGVATSTDIVLDRTELPPVTASIRAIPNPAELHPISNQALIRSSTTVAEAEYCYRYAYRSTDGGETYTQQYRLGGWTKDRSWDRAPGLGTHNQSFYLDRSTRLEIYCLREYDVDFGTPEERENGTERVSLIIEVEPPSIEPPEPVAYMYAERRNYNKDALWDARTLNTGFSESSDFIGTNATGTFQFAFNFEHLRLDDPQVYNVHFRHCDENDGISYFRFYRNGELFGSWTTDRTQVSSNLCDNGSTFTGTVAKGVTIENGDEIRIECDATEGERCRMKDLYFGVGSGDGDTFASEVSSSTGLATAHLMWMSDNASWCDSTPDDNMAITDGGSIYRWYFGNSIQGTMDRPLSTTTTFFMECYRYNPDLSIPRDESSVRVALPTALTLTSSTSVATGECLDPDTLEPIDTPEGYWANPATNICEPAVDLGAVSPAVSIAGAVENNVDGTYDNVEALIAINNFGPGALSENSDISYMANMTFAPVYGLPVLSTPVGIFSNTIAAPPNDVSPTVSPTLTRTFNDVPFGTHQVCTRVNLDGSPDNYPESNPDPANNTSCGSVTLPVPRPPMVFDASPEVIRRGESAELYFEIDVTYQMSCTVRGAGGVDEVFDTLVGPNPVAGLSGASNVANLGSLIAQAPLNSGTITTGRLDSTSKFIFQCTEPITNTTFSEEVTVEVLPTSQEF
jgi:hypothetical protein